MKGMFVFVFFLSYPGDVDTNNAEGAFHAVHLGESQVMISSGAKTFLARTIMSATLSRSLAIRF